MFVKLKSQVNDFWAQDGDRTSNLLMTGKTIQTVSYRDGELRHKFNIAAYAAAISLSAHRSWRFSQIMCLLQQNASTVVFSRL